MSGGATLESYLLDHNGSIPNNPLLPVLIYRGVALDHRQLSSRLAGNGWREDWRGTIHPYHHYHSTAHEFLGVLTGTAELMIGGPGGPLLHITVGDAVVLPAGVGHCCEIATADFELIAAYPDGQDWDLLRMGTPLDTEIQRRIAAVPLPPGDPFEGLYGPLVEAWHEGGGVRETQRVSFGNDR